MWVRSLGWEDPLKKEMATHSSIPAWKIPWTEAPDGLHYSPWGHKEPDMTERLSTHTHTHTHTHCLILGKMVSTVRHYLGRRKEVRLVTKLDLTLKKT